jgi:glycine/D-amino acid oxidase-like deaminating enzyme
VFNSESYGEARRVRNVDGRYDTIVVGAGLAGASAAAVLAERERVLLLDAGAAGGGASSAAAGLVNPFGSQRARPVWRFEEALAALEDLLEQAGAGDLFRRIGVLRPALSADQAAHFARAAGEHPAHAEWLSAPAAAFPDVVAPHGALHVPAGGAVDLPAMVRALVSRSRQSGAEVHEHAHVTAWEETGDAASVTLATGEQIDARRVLLAPGAGISAHAELAAIGLHPVKGQVVRIERPRGLGTLPALAGQGYVVMEDDSLVVGSTYEHVFVSLRPTPEATQLLLERAAAMVPALAGARVLDERAGVRVNTPGTRLPVVGPLPGHARIWLLAGLGSRGLLTAPLLARQLPVFFDDPEAIPAEIRIRVR